MGVATYRDASGAPGLTVGSILFKDNLVEFLIDTADLPVVRDLSWHMTSGGYLATTVVAAATGKKRELYLHTHIMNPAPHLTVQHITDNGLDNRRAALRLVDKSSAAIAAQRAKKRRNVELPPLCGLKPADIPTHIWYVQANGYHRDRFAIEFKTEGILWKSTSSKEVSLQEKLEQAKAKLAELYTIYPHLDPAREEEVKAALEASFYAAIGTLDSTE